jgi:hypothetical protein
MAYRVGKDILVVAKDAPGPKSQPNYGQRVVASAQGSVVGVGIVLASSALIW